MPTTIIEESTTTTLARCEAEVLAGLANERGRLYSARVCSDYYALENAKHLPRREAESSADYYDRPKKIIPFARRVVQVLSKHLYSPGPTRQIKGDKTATDWLNQVYADCLINALWQRANRLSLQGGAAAFQVAASGDPKRPIKLTLWGADEFAVWPDAASPPEFVCTIDAYDNQRTYTLWSADEYRVYKTKKFGGPDANTAGGVLPSRVGGGRNPYGVLPFAFDHAELPIHSFWEGGIGDYLSTANGQADEQLSTLALAIKKFLTPIGIAENCDPEFQVVNKLGAFVKLRSVLASLGLEGQSAPKLSYLQAQLDITGAWDDIHSSLMLVLENLGIPKAAWRMETAQAMSGIAIVVEQLPLIERAREKREPARVYETELAKVVLTCAGYTDESGGRYANAESLAAAAEDLELLLTWPEIQLPSIDRDNADQHAIQMGLTSRLMVIQDRYGLNREQAIERVKQIRIDGDEADEIDPPPVPVAPPPDANKMQPDTFGGGPGAIEAVETISLSDN